MKKYAVRFCCDGSCMGTVEDGMNLTLARANNMAAGLNTKERERADRTGKPVRGEYVVHEMQLNLPTQQ